MPRKTIVVEYCDYCAKEKGEEVEATDTIKINGREALACEAHSKPVRKVLEVFAQVSTPIGRSPAPTPSVAPKTKGKKVQRTWNGHPYIPAQVREWARKENEKAGRTIYPVGERARIPNDVIAAYFHAHSRG